MKILHKVLLTLSMTFALFSMAQCTFADGPAPINLLSAGNFTILAKTGISSTGSTSIVGNIGVSPASATYITGFGLILPVANSFSTSAEVNGNIYSADYGNPTPTIMTTAVNDMQTAYTDGAGRTNPTATELGAGNIGGLTLAPGLYTWSTNVTVPTNLTLSGGANDVWIFVVAQNLTISSATNIVLSGGAQASNIFWIVAGQTTIGTTAIFNGNILDQTAIILNTGATVHGRLLAQSAVTLDSNTVTAPSGSTISNPATNITPTYTPTLQVSCDPIPAGFTALILNNSCIYTPIPVQTSTQSQISSSVSSPNTIALQNELNQLMTNLESLQTEAVSLNSSASPNQSIKTISENLTKGQSDTNVSVLQEFLIAQNKGASAHNLSLVGPTSYFGPLTQTALAEFQASVGISPALGNFGPITREYISTHY